MTPEAFKGGDVPQERLEQELRRETMQTWGKKKRNQPRKPDGGWLGVSLEKLGKDSWEKEAGGVERGCSRGASRVLTEYSHPGGNKYEVMGDLHEGSDETVCRGEGGRARLQVTGEWNER